MLPSPPPEPQSTVASVAVEVHVQITALGVAATPAAVAADPRPPDMTASRDYHAATHPRRRGRAERGEGEKAADDQSNIMGISLFLVCLCQLNNCNKSVRRSDRRRTCRSHTHTHSPFYSHTHPLRIYAYFLSLSFAYTHTYKSYTRIRPKTPTRT